MIVLEPDKVEHGIALSAAQALDNDQYYTQSSCLCIQACKGKLQSVKSQVPQSLVLLSKFFEYEGARRLVVALPNSAILVSQEWLTTIAGWTFVSGSKPGLKNSVCENKVYPAGADSSFVLSMKDGLPYLSKELFWRAMEDIAKKAKLISGHKWSELKDMIDNRTYEPQPQVYSVKTVAVPETPKVVFSATPCTQHFIPNNVRKQIVDWFEHFHPASDPNRGRLSG